MAIIFTLSLKKLLVQIYIKLSLFFIFNINILKTINIYKKKNFIKKNRVQKSMNKNKVKQLVCVSFILLISFTNSYKFDYHCVHDEKEQ
jgi:hypothetical protein